jgi:hypothetical protein
MVEAECAVPEPLSAITWHHLPPVVSSLERVVEVAHICGAKFTVVYPTSPRSTLNESTPDLSRVKTPYSMLVLNGALSSAVKHRSEIV